jgi:hypothetical protein
MMHNTAITMTARAIIFSAPTPRPGTKREGVMSVLSHSRGRLSMRILGMMAAISCAGQTMAASPTGPYFGRWTVSDDRPVFTARGKLYKGFDVAPCGRDFCGVSVDDRGNCGATLFRFLSTHARGEDMLKGHGRWGTGTKNIVVYTIADESFVGGRNLEIYLGDGYDFGDRSENMPKFHANYKRLGDAKCVAR